MPLVKIRDLDKAGFFFDQPDNDLPDNGFSRLDNVRAHGRSLTKSGAFRSFETTPSGQSNYCIAGDQVLKPNGDVDTFFLSFDLYAYRLVGAVYQDVSAAASTHPAWPNYRPTMAPLAGCMYYTRGDQELYGITPGASTFQLAHTTQWSGWKWRVVRAFKNHLLVLNGEDGSGNQYPGRVAWSNIMYDGNLAVGAEWDPTDLTKLAGFTEDITQGRPILDAAPWNDDMLVYTAGTCVKLRHVGGRVIFESEPFLDNDGVLFTGGVINIDEVGQFVVGNDSIYITDGHTKKDIAEDRVEDYLRQRIDNATGRPGRSWLHHEPADSEVWIVFTTNDVDETYWNATDWSVSPWPNKALVWNYRSNIWYTRDVPIITCSVTAQYVTGALTYANLEGDTEMTYDKVSGRYMDYEGLRSDHKVHFGFGLTDSGGLRSADLLLYGDQTSISGAVVSRDIPDTIMERKGMDFDNWNMPLNSTKLLSKILPQNDALEGILKVQAGFSFAPTTGYQWLPAQNFETGVDTWKNFRAIGRYLGYRITAEGTTPLKLNGVDLEVTMLAER